MLATLALAALAGALTVLNPCVLPVLPIIMASALGQGRFGPLALVGGLALSFALAGVLVASAGFSLGIDDAVLRPVAASLLLAAGLVVLSPRLQAGFATAAGPLAAAVNERAGPKPFGLEGLPGQFAIGAVLGVAWAPCVGPTLGAATGLAAAGGSPGAAALTMAAFAAGAGAPMLALAYGSREALARRRGAARAVAARGKAVLGGALVAVGLLVLTGLDKRIEAALLAVLPEGLIGLTTRY